MTGEKITSPVELMEIVNGFRSSKIILTAYELNLFTIIGGNKKTSAEIASGLNLNQRALDRLMNALTALGLLEKKREKFSNTSFSLKFLVKTSPAYLGGIAHIVNLWDTWDKMTDSVRAGTAILNRGQINDRCNDWLEAFISAMHSRAPQHARIIAHLLDFKNVKVLLDVGGGSGDFSFEFIRKNKNLKAVVFDLPNVTQITEKYIAMEGMEEIVKTVPGDYLTDEIGEGYDIAFLSAVIHSNSPDENKLLFKKCFNALNNKGQIVILDYIMDDKRTEPLMGALFALNMLVGTDKGDTYTEKEISSWMKEAGFKRIKKIKTPLDTALMIGSR